MATAGCDSFVRIGHNTKGGCKRIHLDDDCAYVKAAMKKDSGVGDIKFYRNSGIRRIYAPQTGEWLENKDDYDAFRVFCGTAGHDWLNICDHCRRRAS